MKPGIIMNWIRRDFFRFSSDESFDVVESDDSKVVVKLYTDINQYTITATVSPQVGGFLMAGATGRKPRAGEDWNRGNDLADGALSEETWARIKNDIISYELVLLARYRKKYVPGMAVSRTGPADTSRTAEP